MKKSNQPIAINEISRRVAEVQARWSSAEATRRQEAGACRREQLLALLGLAETQTDSQPELVAA